MNPKKTQIIILSLFLTMMCYQVPAFSANKPENTSQIKSVKQIDENVFSTVGNNIQAQLNLEQLKHN